MSYSKKEKLNILNDIIEYFKYYKPTIDQEKGLGYEDSECGFCVGWHIARCFGLQNDFIESLESENQVYLNKDGYKYTDGEKFMFKVFGQDFNDELDRICRYYEYEKDFYTSWSDSLDWDAEPLDVFRKMRNWLEAA